VKRRHRHLDRVEALGICKTTGKMKYGSRKEASIKRRQQLTAEGKVYACPDCQCWHISSERRTTTHD
jgi:hypothetical protein